MITKTITQPPHPWGRLGAWEKAYILALDVELQMLSLAQRPDVIEVIKTTAVDAFRMNQSAITDLPSQHHLLMSSYVLASYKVIREYSQDKTQILRVLERAFSSPGAVWIKRMMRLALMMKRDKMKVVMAYGGAKKTKELYGESFVIEQEGDGKSFFSSNVKRCAYHEFFKVNDAQELTQVFCAWDKLWADEIKSERDGIRFERTSTLAEGAAMCRFEFHRI